MVRKAGVIIIFVIIIILTLQIACAHPAPGQCWERPPIVEVHLNGYDVIETAIAQETEGNERNL